MRDKISEFKAHVRQVSENPDFVHHKWFVKWHLEIVERIANELLARYPQANHELVEVMVWLHDYGKILDFENQYTKTLSAGADKLTEIGFPAEFIKTAIDNIEMLDKSLEMDLSKAPIEVQIVSSADGCSHMIGPFFSLWWYENYDKPIEELMHGNQRKVLKDWNRKITLPEARATFETRFNFIMEQSGRLPEKFLSS